MSDLQTLADAVARVLVERGETLAVAESSSGGLVAAALLATAGASRFFTGGGVIYTARAREALLGITPAMMETMRPATEPYAGLLADRARVTLGTVWGLGETGAAGPTGNRYGDAPGHTCVAVAGPSSLQRTIATGHADRARNMQRFALSTLQILLEGLHSASSQGR